MPLRYPERPVVLPDSLIIAWQSTLLEFGRLRQAKDLTTMQQLERLVVQERPAVEELWQSYTSERSRLNQKLLNSKQQAVAYLLSSHLANCTRMWSLLVRTSQRCDWLEHIGSSYSLVDLGCGTGALSAAFLSYAPKLHPRQIILCDAAKPLLEAAAHNIQQLTRATVHTYRTKIEDVSHTERWADGGTVLLLGYVWNEIARNRRASQVLGKLLEQCRKNATAIFLMEPATAIHARQAMELRDQLCKLGYLAVYPCPPNLHCPMLDRPTDRCYSELGWDMPNLQRKIDRPLGVRRQTLGCSMYAFVSQTMWEKSAKRKLPENVVVGRPENKSGIDYLLCSTDEITKVPSTDKELVLARGATYAKS